MRSFMAGMGPHKKFKYGLVRGRSYAAHNLWVIGIYDSEIYSGTDRLSMAVQPHAERFIKSQCVAGEDDVRIIAEGDRLTTPSFFSNIMELDLDLQIVYLNVPPDVQESRRSERMDTKKGSWLKGRETKLSSITSRFECVEIPHQSPEDTDAAVRVISDFMGI